MADPLRPVDEQLARVLDPVAPLPPIELGLADARGCVLAEDVVALWPSPPFDNSAMDGYAVASTSVGHASAGAPVRLQVIEDIPAGAYPRSAVGPGTAARIMTGAPMPYGADAVVPVERTDGGMPVVTLYAPAAPGEFVRRAGDDIRAGTTVLAAGTVLDARHSALAAVVGRGRVLVHPRPRVVVLTTGSELVEPGRQLRPGLINDVNGISLAAAGAAVGADVYRVGPVPDDPQILRGVLEDQIGRADLIVTTGGVSVGAYDIVKAVLGAFGTVEFVRVAMQPGMPQGHGYLAGVPIFTLPGNPVSAYVSFQVFVAPVVRRLRGVGEVLPATVEATATSGFDSPEGKRQYARGLVVRTAQGNLFHPAASQGSHQVHVLAQATGLMVVPEAMGRVEAGDRLPVIPLVDGDG